MRQFIEVHIYGTGEKMIANLDTIETVKEETDGCSITTIGVNQIHIAESYQAVLDTIFTRSI